MRFFSNKKVHECFLDFEQAYELDTRSLSALIIKKLQIYGLDIKSCLIRQCYDGASVMNGVNKGVQQKVRQVAPLAIYTHCYAHKLNLVLVDTCKAVQDAEQFFHYWKNFIYLNPLLWCINYGWNYRNKFFPVFLLGSSKV